MEAIETLTTRCCIVGGGPAGLMLGLLLARAGVGVVVLEAHADFLRDFRGDTIHPSTMESLADLGLLDDFLRLPHVRLERFSVQVGGAHLTVADFSHLPVRAPFIALMPQWDFLDFIARAGRRYAGFSLRMECQAESLLEDGDRIVGVRAMAPHGPIDVRADLVVAADGRGSRLRACSGLPIVDIGAPMDALWFRLSRRTDDPAETGIRVDANGVLVALDRGDYWQCAAVIPKGGFERLRAEGIEAFRARIATRSPFDAARLAEIASFEQVRLLTVQVNRLAKWWRPGLLCIGDAAHAMSPIGGVGVNLAIQDAIATANLLSGPLRRHAAVDALLAAVQRRREWPTRITQRLQVAIQNNVIAPALGGGRFTPPAPLRLIARFPRLARLPARLIGMGVRPERVRSVAW